MKKTKRRLSLKILSLLVAMLVFMGGFSITASAYEGERVTIDLNKAYNSDGGLITWNANVPGGSKGQPIYRIATMSSSGTKDAYCIQPGTHLNYMDTLTESSSYGAWWNLTADQRQAIIYAMTFGKDGNSNNLKGNSDEKYVATALICWEIVKGYRNADSPHMECTDTTYRDSGSTPGSNIRYNYNVISDGMYNAKVIPSFTSKRKASAPTINLQWDTKSKRWTGSITDTNKVLSNFKFSGTYAMTGGSTLTVTQSGNTLNLSCNASSTGQHSLVNPIGSKNINFPTGGSTSDIVAYSDGSLQDCVGSGSADPPFAYFNVQTLGTEGNDFFIQKEVWTEKGWDDSSLIESPIGNAETLSGWYFHVTSSSKGHIVDAIVGPTDELGQTDVISSYSSTPIYDGVYEIQELGKLINGRSGTSLSDFYMPSNYTPAFDSYDYTLGLDIPDGVSVVRMIGYTNIIDNPNIRITKNSDNGDNAGFYFKVYLKDNPDVSFICGPTSTGKGSTMRRIPNSIDIRPGTTIVIEELGKKNSDGTYSIPPEFEIPQPLEYTIEADNFTDTPIVLTFHNICLGSFQIEKSDSENGNKIANATYSIYNSDATDKDGNLLEYAYVGDITTGTDGTVTSDKLPLGKYYLKEKTAPENYEKDENIYTVEVVAGSNVNPVKIELKDTPSKGNVVVQKSADDNLVSNIEFKLEGTSATGQKVNMTALTDETGKAAFNNVLVGSYTVTEVTDNIRYEITEAQNVTVTADNTSTVEFDNKLKKADMMIKKTSEDNIVKDIAFSVKSDYKDYGTFTTDENGVINVKNLPVYDSDNNKITYQIRELGELQSDGTYKLPFRYNEPQNQTATLEYGKTTTVNFTNTLKTGSVTINKQDGWGNPLSGVEFELYKNDGTKLTLCENTTGSYSVSSDGTITALTTDENGKIIVGELAQGNYYLVEVKSSSGTMPYTERIEFSIVAEDETTLNPEISVKDNKIIMYNTGGFGDTGLYILAAVIFTAALGLLIVFFKIKRKSGKEKNKMNKKSHRILSVFIAVMILLISSIPFVGAAETQTALDTGTKVSFTLNCEKKGYTFQVYQVGKLTTSKNPYETKYESLVPEIADSVLNGNTADMLSALDEIEAMPSEAISKGIFVSSATTKTRTFRNLEQGIYYVRATNYPAGVKSVTNSVFALPYYNNESGWIYEIPAINLAEKVNDDIPETHKSITNSTQNNENFTDVSLGDTVSFQIKSSTAGSNQMKLNAYTVSDDMNKGLTLDKNSFNVSLLDDEGKKISDLAKSDYTVDITNEKEGENTLFSVVLSKDYLQKADFYSAAYTSITYNANLNKYASVGFAGNPNKLTALSYTNKNGVTAEIEGNIVYVYTWSIYVDKFNEKGEVLNGAEFSLYKTKEDVNSGKALGNGISDEKGKVYFYNSDNEEIRLQSGKYYIKETKAPTGYNLYTDVIEISIDVTYGDTFVNDTYVTGGPGDGYASVEVKNTQTILPQTGGNGAIILYVLSGISLAGAITLFVVRRKIKN